jgi:thiol-disulfide isomerase/thioredoxin
MIAWGSACVVLATVLVIVLVAVTRGTTQLKVPTGALGVSEAVAAKVTTVPASVLDQVGIGGNAASSNPATNAVNVVARSGGSLPPVDGKPAFFYYGAEWCPYCATERWSIVVALSRFGAFQELSGGSSSPTDAYPNTQTFTFHGTTYTSPYVTFLGVEAENTQQLPLDRPNAVENRVLTVWDRLLEFPFVDIGGRYIGGLPAWGNPQLLGGLTRSEIAQMLWEPASPVGSMIDANANYLTAAICAVDGDRPDQVCRSTGVQAAAKQLKSLPKAVPIT